MKVPHGREPALVLVRTNASSTRGIKSHQMFLGLIFVVLRVLLMHEIFEKTPRQL
jgi:hypothetical protein